MTTKRRAGTVRIDLHVPPELAAAIDRRATRRERNALILRTLAAAFGVQLRPEDVAPKLGRPRKDATDGEAAGPG